MLYKKLIEMEERPGLFNCDTIEAVYSFIQGYGYALQACNGQDPDFIKFENFVRFVKKQYKMQGSKANWAMVIRFHSNSNQEALSNFFTTLNQFKSQG